MRPDTAGNTVSRLSPGVIYLWCIAITFAWYVLLALVLVRVV